MQIFFGCFNATSKEKEALGDCFPSLILEHGQTFFSLLLPSFCQKKILCCSQAFAQRSVMPSLYLPRCSLTVFRHPSLSMSKLFFSVAPKLLHSAQLCLPHSGHFRNQQRKKRHWATVFRRPSFCCSQVMKVRFRAAA